MLNQEGPTEVVLPPRIERRCTGCKFHQHVKVNGTSFHVCVHPAELTPERLKHAMPGRYLGSTDLTPNDCPVLKAVQNV